MPNKIERLSSVTAELTVTADVNTTPVIPFGAAAGGTIFVEAVSGAGSISWHVSYGPEGNAFTVIDGAPVTTSIAAGAAYPIPDALYAAPFIRAVADAGTANIVVSLKG